MSKSNINIVKDEPTKGYIIIGKNQEGVYKGKTAYGLHYLFVYMMLCTVISTLVFIGLLVEVITN